MYRIKATKPMGDNQVQNPAHCRFRRFQSRQAAFEAGTSGPMECLGEMA
jgi:hypothetical protein